VPQSVARTAKGATHRMINKDGAGRPDLSHDVEDCTDNKGWDSVTLDDMGDETDGLVAEGSVGDEQCQIHARFRESTCYSGRQLPLDRMVGAHGPHERDVNRRQTPHQFLLYETCED
jgi:hypothetical protein